MEVGCSVSSNRDSWGEHLSAAETGFLGCSGVLGEPHPGLAALTGDHVKTLLILSASSLVVPTCSWLRHVSC